MNRIYKLKGVVQNYSWGGNDYLPQLLGVQNAEQKPFGEYWLGAHPAAPAVVEEENQPLDQFIAAGIADTLGEHVAGKFGSLPYLFKILDVRQMLSIQVHPTKQAAEKAFEEENEKGVPLKAAHRNYKDKNHKPELMVALSDFYLLHGFKKEEELSVILDKVPELQFLLPAFAKGNYKALYEEVMTMPQEKVDAVLTPLLDRIVPLYQQNSLQKSSEDFWAARAALSFCKEGHYDRGIFSIYFFNLLYVKEGEAIYQPAGLPHAYLEGQNVEVMANSDNVLRAGLTDKHVDVAELMKHVRFEATIPNILRDEKKEEQTFHTPAEEFQLTKYSTDEQRTLEPETASIVFVHEGEAMVKDGQKAIPVKRGEAVLLLPSSGVFVEPLAGKMVLFTVSTPMDKN